MAKDTIRETTKTIVERRIELNAKDILDLLVRLEVVSPLKRGDNFDVGVTVPSGADWSGMDLDMNDTPVVVTITRKTETVK